MKNHNANSHIIVQNYLHHHTSTYVQTYIHKIVYNNANHDVKICQRISNLIKSLIPHL